MAAAEYYSSGARPSGPLQPSTIIGPPPPQRTSSHPAVIFTPPSQGPMSQPYQPQYPPPPPYHQNQLDDQQHNHLGRPPGPGPGQPQRPSISYPQRPDAQSWNQPRPQYLAPNSNPRPGPYPGPYEIQSYSHPNPDHHSPHAPQGLYPEPVDYGYISDPEHHRRKHRHRKDGERRISDHSRSTTADGFLGAAGGGLIGDLIFPGLGTVGGALAGWIGGKDYGKHRKWREDKREREQEDWERKFGRRSRSDSNDRRRDSHDTKRDSHDSRRDSRDNRRDSHDSRRGSHDRRKS